LALASSASLISSVVLMASRCRFLHDFNTSMTVGQIDSQPSVATPPKSDLRCGSSPSVAPSSAGRCLPDLRRSEASAPRERSRAVCNSASYALRSRRRCRPVHASASASVRSHSAVIAFTAPGAKPPGAARAETPARSRPGCPAPVPRPARFFRHELFQITACEIPTHEVADQVMRWAKIETALEHEHLG
jgi:hypothetical protein